MGGGGGGGLSTPIGRLTGGPGLSISARLNGQFLKGTKRQHSGLMSQIFKTVKTIEIQPVRQTEVYSKVSSEKNG